MKTRGEGKEKNKALEESQKGKEVNEMEKRLNYLKSISSNF